MKSLSVRRNGRSSFIPGECLSYMIRSLLWQIQKPATHHGWGRSRPSRRDSQRPAPQLGAVASPPFHLFFKMMSLDRQDGCFNQSWPVRWPSLCEKVAGRPFHVVTLRGTEQSSPPHGERSAVRVPCSRRASVLRAAWKGQRLPLIILLLLCGSHVACGTRSHN